MLARLFWLLICRRVHDNHVRDWYAFDALGLSQCLLCHRKMTPPPLARRERL